MVQTTAPYNARCSHSVKQLVTEVRNVIKMCLKHERYRLQSNQSINQSNHWEVIGIYL